MKANESVGHPSGRASRAPGRPAFVDVRRVSVDYPLTGSWRKLTGRNSGAVSVLRELSFELALGDQVTLYGAPSSGKTTLLRMLAGAVEPASGRVLVNGRKPSENDDAAAGYVSSEETEPRGDSVQEVLHAFGTTHGIDNLPARVGEVAEQLDFANVLSRRADRLSTTERMKLNVARAVLSDAPVVLLDDTADDLGPNYVKHLLLTVLAERTVVVATRFAATAEALDLPILLLHEARLAQRGTRDELAAAVACPRAVEVWVEGLRYDLLRRLRTHPGVTAVQLVPTDGFAGQKLRVMLHSSRYLPSLYDVLSQAELVRVEEVPPSLVDILERL